MKGPVKSFVNQVVARMKGDTATVTAEKNFRKASAGIKGQIAALESKVMEAEEKMDEAKEQLENAKYPTELIGSVNDYVSNIKRKQEAHDSVKEELETVQHSIKYYVDLLAGFEEVVEASSKAEDKSE